MVVIDDAIEPDDLSRHLETCDLIASVFGGYACLEKARADGIQRRERLSGAEQCHPALDFAARSHNVVDALQLLVI